MADEEAKQKEALNATLKEYISEWRATREKEEEELKKLKEKQAKRKEIRSEQVDEVTQQEVDEKQAAVDALEMDPLTCFRTEERVGLDIPDQEPETDLDWVSLVYTTD